MTPQNNGIVIKKYANRRLYNPQTSTYITLEDLAGLIREGEDFSVVDARTGDDITQNVLMQVIADEVGQQGSAFAPQFMRRLIRLYGKGQAHILGQYLDLVMHMYIRKQDELKAHATEAYGTDPFDGHKHPSDTAQNTAILKKTFHFLDVSNIGASDVSPKDEKHEQVQALKDQVRKLNEEIDRLRKG